MRRVVLLGALVVLLLAFAVPAAHAGGSSSRPTVRPCNGHVELCSRRLDEVALAGTHNSMSAAQLNWTGPNQLYDIPTQLRRGVHAMLIDTYYGIRQPNGIVVTVQADMARAQRELGSAARAPAVRRACSAFATCGRTRARCSSSSTRTTCGRTTTPRSCAQAG